MSIPSSNYIYRLNKYYVNKKKMVESCFEPKMLGFYFKPQILTARSFAVPTAARMHYVHFKKESILHKLRPHSETKVFFSLVNDKDVNICSVPFR